MAKSNEGTSDEQNRAELKIPAGPVRITRRWARIIASPNLQRSRVSGESRPHSPPCAVAGSDIAVVDNYPSIADLLHPLSCMRAACSSEIRRRCCCSRRVGRGSPAAAGCRSRRNPARERESRECRRSGRNGVKKKMSDFFLRKRNGAEGCTGI